MKKIIVAAVAFAALPGAALANDARNPQPSFNDFATVQYEAPARGAPSGRAEFPRPSFVDHSELTGVSEVAPVAADATQPVRAATSALPQPSFNG